MKRLTPEDFLKRFAMPDDTDFHSEINDALWTNNVLKYMQAYAEHLEQTRWVELDQTIRMSDCKDLPEFGVDVIVQYQGEIRLDKLVRRNNEDSEGGWTSYGNSGYRPNARAERWCYVPSQLKNKE